MAKTADPFRVQRAQALGADVRLVKDNLKAFTEARQMEAAGGATFVHPWDGPKTSLGTATIALELDADLPPEVETYVVAIGGGSLISGLAPVMKALRPGARVIGVEPVGAPNIHDSLAEGRPLSRLPTGTIADSLAAPFAEPYSFGLVRDFVDKVILVKDEAIRDAMKEIFRRTRLVVEPAAATALAGIRVHPQLFPGPTLAMICGSNIGAERYQAVMGGFPDDND